MEQKSVRTKRTPISGRRNILTVRGKDESFHYRWVSDDEMGRIDAFKEAGYEAVSDDVKVGEKRVDNATPIGSAVTTPSKDGRKLVLMRIKKEWYKEDQEAKQRDINETEAAMKRQEAEKDGRYIPKGEKGIVTEVKLEKQVIPE
jgi:hypothetical protein